MIETFIPEREDDINIKEIAAQTQKYSGSDMKSFCKEALMRPLRRFISKMELPNGQYKRLRGEAKLEKVTKSDLEDALSCSNPSPAPDDAMYRKWFKQYGST